MQISSDHPEIALSLSEPNSLDRLIDLGAQPSLSECYRLLGCPSNSLKRKAQNWPVTRIYLGNEFCERLIPSVRSLNKILKAIKSLDLKITLVTPMLTDMGFKQIDKLLPKLPEGTEIVINDWGMLHRLKTDYPSFVPVLGRMLNKMIKDPRLPSEKWTQLHPHNSHPGHFQSLLERFGISHLEMDVPPFVQTDQFNTGPMDLSVHLPYGYTVKGRMCRIGSVGLKDQDKFFTAHACHKECLDYWVEAERPKGNMDKELSSFQRGNTQFYRHSAAMTDTLWLAMKNGWIKRLIFAGDWHENSISPQ